MQIAKLTAAVALMVTFVFTAAGAHEPSHALPAGPIRDRHELMEGIGKNAKIINDALKADKSDRIAGAAENIRASAGKIAALFPPGSTDPKSRAKPEIWTNWPKFKANTEKLETVADALATTAKNGGDIKAAASDMFSTCKSCHDDFRVPEKKKQ